MLPDILNLALLVILLNEESVVLTGVRFSVEVLVLDAGSAAQKFLMKWDVGTSFVGMYEAIGKVTCFCKQRMPFKCGKINVIKKLVTLVLLLEKFWTTFSYLPWKKMSLAGIVSSDLPLV